MANIIGTFFNDLITPSAVSSGVSGVPTASADTINGGAGADTMNGGSGNDTYIVDNTGDIVRETADDTAGGIDLIEASVSYSLAPGTAGNQGFGIENLTLTGTAAINATGNAKANVLRGNSAANVLNGGLGHDTMNGGDSSDTYIVESVFDVVTENSDTSIGGTADTVQASVSYTLGSGSAAGQNGFGIENLTLTGTASINGTGNAKANVLTGNSVSNLLSGGQGADTLNGGYGLDTMNGGEGNDFFIVDFLLDYDNSTDIVTESTDDATGGIDTVLASLTYTLGNGIAAGQNGFGVENLTLTGSAAINGTGNAKANMLTGNTASNLLRGGSGADTLNGGDGVDTTNGGSGNDTFIVDQALDVVTEDTDDSTGGTADTVLSSISYTLGSGAAAGQNGFGIENLTLTGIAAINGTGNAKANVLKGNSAVNVLTGGAGVDTMNGGGGNDTYFVDSLFDVVTEDVDTSAGGTADTVQSSFSYTLGSGTATGQNGYGIENLTLSGVAAINGTGNAKANVLIGNSVNNLLSGGLGADTLIGGYGVDTMNGGDGNDIFIIDFLLDFDNSSDIATESLDDATGGIDTVLASLTYTLGSGTVAGQSGFGIENLTLTGSDAINGTGNAKANVLTGNSAANVLNGGAGEDTLNGAGGIDTMNGGSGNDTYIVDNASDRVSESFNDLAAGVDAVRSSVSYSLAPGSLGNQGYGIENLILIGSAAINATGNGKANALTGNTGANRIAGGAGTDTLFGDLGNDVFVLGELGATNRDQVTDFNAAADKFELANSLDSTLTGALATGVKGLSFNGGNATGNPLLTAWFFRGAGFTGAASGSAAGIYVDTTTGDIFYNDDNAAGSYIIANVATSTAGLLTTLNFIYGA